MPVPVPVRCVVRASPARDNLLELTCRDALVKFTGDDGDLVPLIGLKPKHRNDRSV